MVKTIKTIKKNTTKIARKVSVAKLMVDQYDLTGKKVSQIAFPYTLTTKPLNPKLLTQAVRIFQANLRQGTQKAKTRGEVIGSTRKIYKQKGTGRARHGDIKAPIFVGGGIVFAPKPRDYSLKFPQKMKQLLTQQLISQKLQKSQIKVITGIADATGKTNQINTLLTNLHIADKHNLFVIDKDMSKAILASRNIQNLAISSAHNLSLLSLLQCENILIVKEALTKISIFKNN